MTSIAICAHDRRPQVVALIDTIGAWADAHGHKTWLASGFADGVSHRAVPSAGHTADADLVVSLGGDGTMLHAVASLDGAPVPLLGVNLGQLGYLTEIEPDDVVDALDRFVRGADAGGWHLDERMLLHVAAECAGAPAGEWRALNEAIVEKAGSGHTVQLLASIDGEAFTSYVADGLIVATPTGSTAYSLSARGPIVSPRHRALLVTPVSPHMLFDRALVLDPTETVEISVLGDRAAEVAVDGRAVATLTGGDTIRCRPAAETARFVRFGPFRYHQILKAKFGLADR